MANDNKMFLDMLGHNLKIQFIISFYAALFVSRGFSRRSASTLHMEIRLENMERIQKYKTK